MDNARSPSGGQPTVQFLGALNSAVYRDVAYSVRMEPGVQALTRHSLGASAPAVTRPGCW